MATKVEVPTAARKAITRMVDELKSVPSASFEVIVVHTGADDRRIKAKIRTGRGRAAKSIAARCRELFEQGYSNDRAWKVIQKEYKKDDRHKGIVSWYRAADRRKAATKGKVFTSEAV